MITVRVFRRRGGPQSHRQVSVHSGSTQTKENTDANGSANFERLYRGEYTVYVDGKEVYKGLIVDVQVVYID